MRPRRCATRTTIYICPPGFSGGAWVVSQFNRCDVMFESEAEARTHALKRAATVLSSGTQVDVRMEGRDGLWREVPVAMPVDRGEVQ